MSLPRISVLLPVYNGADYLEKAIASVLLQSMSSFELLVGNNHSTDATPQIIKNFRDSRIRCFDRPNNVGLFANVNLLLQEAQAPLVRFLSHDDLLMPDCLEAEINFFDTHPHVGMSFCKAIVIDESGNVIDRWMLGDLPPIIPPELSAQLFFYYGCIPGTQSTVCARKKCFEEVGNFNETYYNSGDYEMWVRICKRYDLGVIHKHLIQLRNHGKQLSRSPRASLAAIAENREIRAELLHLLPQGTRSRAKLYSKLRHNVLDVHYCVRCALSGRLKDSFRIIRTIGLSDFSLGLLTWFFTVNNRLHRPHPRLIGG